MILVHGIEVQVLGGERNAGSSNGRTTDFGSVYHGSNPCPAASPSGGTVDTPVSNTGAEMRAGSNPALGTKRDIIENVS